jgi:hypothetical protein
LIATRRRYSRRSAVVAACVVFGAAVASCGGGSSPSIPKFETTTTLSAAQAAANRQARREVAVTSCGPNDEHNMTINGTAHNTTARPATYTIQLVIRSRTGSPLYYTAAEVHDVPAHRVGRWSAATTAPYVTGMRCTITSATRPAA